MGMHRVEPGETLYSIAWQYGLNWRRLAQWNHISPPYTIYPGQQLRLNGRTPAPVRPPRRAPSTARSAPPPADSGTGAMVPSSRPKPADRLPVRDSGHWVWPVTAAQLKGERVTVSRQGINIAGKVGAPVLAAKAGRVVYSGSGLPGYGKLVIIKHDGHYLSAYGFNSRLLVSEGTRVVAGEKIAEMGMGPGQSPMLHFEIRHDGQPMDVSSILPRSR